MLINSFKTIKNLPVNVLKKQLFIFLATFFSVGASTLNQAMALTATGTVNVNATILASCSFTVPSIAFGTYNGTLINQQGNISVTCTNGAPYWISLSVGGGSGATVATRKMTIVAGSTTLNYSLYRDTNHTQVWGVTNGTDTVSGTGNGSAQSITVYGQMLASQPLTVGNYNDTVTATINY